MALYPKSLRLGVHVPLLAFHLRKLWARTNKGRRNHDHDHFWIHLAGPHFSFLGYPRMTHQMPLLNSGTQRNHKDFSSDVSSNAVLVWHRMQIFLENYGCGCGCVWAVPEPSGLLRQNGKNSEWRRRYTPPPPVALQGVATHPGCGSFHSFECVAGMSQLPTPQMALSHPHPKPPWRVA